MVMEENTQEQNKKQNYDWLNGYKFVKGQSGNPGGRPKGSKSLKTFAREYLESIPDEEKIEFLRTLPSEMVWRMAEGNPTQDNKTEIKGEITLNQELIDKANEALRKII
jgi:hypothetical protein